MSGGRAPSGSGFKIAWLWAVPGAGNDVRGVAPSFGRAQERAQQSLKAGLTAVAESARVVYDPVQGQDTYAPTGRRWTGHLAGNRVLWRRSEERREAAR